MGESDLYPAIIGEFSHGATRIFRQQSLLAWAGKVIARSVNTVTLLNPHVIKIGAPGMSDLGGLTSHEITAADIGRTLAIYLAIECKAGKARANPEQTAFLEMVARLGGRAGIARSIEDAGRIIRG
jgi:hypothetical protein